MRFEVFKRDKFTCQYCGQKAPDIILALDHIHPHSKGGEETMLNLVTSCEPCNSGKSDRILSDDTIVSKQHAQLTALQERKEQLAMMYEWQKGLLEIESGTTESLSSYWSECVPGYSLNESGKVGLRKLLSKYQLDEIMVAMKIASENYLAYSNGQPSSESVETAWYKVGGICRLRRQEVEEPNLKDLYYIRGILRNRLSYIDLAKALTLLKNALAVGITSDQLSDVARTCRSWTSFQTIIADLIDQEY